VRKRVKRRRWSYIALGTAVVVVVLLLEVSRLVPAARQMSAAAANIQTGAGILGSEPSAWTAARIDQASGYQRSAAFEIATSGGILQHDPLAWVARHLPLLGDQLHTVNDLVDGAAAANAALGDEIQIAAGYSGAAAQAKTPGERGLALIAASQAPLADAALQLRGPLGRLRTDQGRRLLPPLRARVDQAVDQLGPRYDQAVAASGAAQFMPSVLGAGGSRTYLLLLPDPAELRPAGGFSGVVGTITFRSGNPTISLQDVAKVDTEYKHPFPPPATGLSARMKFLNGGLSLGDLIDPNFPTMAPLAEAMYKSATGQPVDGTIAIDPYAISALLATTGPTDVPVYGSFDSSNFMMKLQAIVNASQGPSAGKPALAPIASAILRHVLEQPASAYPKVLVTLAAEARSRHIQVSLHDPVPAAAAARAHFDGAILPAPDDYLMVVDANVGATKGDLYMHRSAKLSAEVPASGLSRHELVLRYELPPPVDQVDRILNAYNAYQDYVQVLLPPTATLTSFHYTLDGKPGTGTLDGVYQADGKQVVGAFFQLPRGHTAEIRLDYEVALQGGHGDELYVQKQAGTPGMPLALDVSYPGGRKQATLDLATDHDVRLAW